MNSKPQRIEALARALDVLDMLRANCPWDKEQTFDSLRTNSIEEVYELSEAIEKKDFTELKKELGDVLLHVLFYAKMAQEQGLFDIADVCNSLCNKLIYRHPHIYSSSTANTPEAVVSQWEKVKQTEKEGNKTLFSGVPNALPSLIKAFRIGEKAAAIGFDWNRKEEVWEKVAEEQAEVKAAIENKDSDNLEEEFGDLFFALVNAARLYGVNPDTALERTNRKFMRRVGYIEAHAKSENRQLASLTLDEMEQLWNEAKAGEGKQHNK